MHASVEPTYVLAFRQLKTLCSCSATPSSQPRRTHVQSASRSTLACAGARTAFGSSTMLGTLPRARHPGTVLSHGWNVVIKKKRVNGEPLTAVTAPPTFSPRAAWIIAVASTVWRRSVAPG